MKSDRDAIHERLISVECPTEASLSKKELSDEYSFYPYVQPLVNTVDYPNIKPEPTPPVPSEPSFAGFKIAKGNLYYGLEESDEGPDIFGHICDDPFYSTWEEGRGQYDEGSTYFSGRQCKDVEVDGYRFPTKTEGEAIIGLNRPGSTIKGVSGRHYTQIEVDDDDSLKAILLFPDNYVIKDNDDVLSNAIFDNASNNNYITIEKALVEEFLDQGCAILPLFGYYDLEDEGNGVEFNSAGYYGTSDCDEYEENAYALRIEFSQPTTIRVEQHEISVYCSSVRLIKSIN